MMKKFTFILIFVLCLALVFSGCAPQIQQAPDNPGGESVGAVTQHEVVYLGVLLPLSGAYAQQAALAKAAMEVGAELINNSHDMDWPLADNAGLAAYGGAKVELLFTDCGSTSASCTTAANALIDLGASIIIGAGTPDMTAAAALVCGRRDMPMIATHWHPAFGDGRIELWEGFNCMGVSYQQETALLLEYLNQLNLTQNTGLKNVAVAYEDAVNSRYWNEITEEQLVSGGFTQVASIVYSSADNDLAEEAAKMLANQPQALMQISSAAALHEFFNSYRNNKNTPSVIFCLGSGYEAAATLQSVERTGLEVVYGASICPVANYSSSSDTAADKIRSRASALFPQINGLYRAKTNANMTDTTFLDMSTVLIAASCVETAGTTDRETLVDTLRDTAFDAPWLFSGTVDFDDQGMNSIAPAFVSRITGGSYEYIY